MGSYQYYENSKQLLIGCALGTLLGGAAFGWGFYEAALALGVADACRRHECLLPPSVDWAFVGVVVGLPNGFFLGRWLATNSQRRSVRTLLGIALGECVGIVIGWFLCSRDRTSGMASFVLAIIIAIACTAGGYVIARRWPFPYTKP